MMMELETYLHRGRTELAQRMLDSRVRNGVRGALCVGVGLVMSAASIRNAYQPLALGLICALTGWRAVAVGFGSALGYLLFWGQVGVQGVIWSLGACLISQIFGTRPLARDVPLFMSAVASLIVSAVGLCMQIVWADTTPIAPYLLRVVLAGASTEIFRRASQRDSPLSAWLAQGLLVLALAQVAPARWLCLGFAAGALIASRESFPAAAVAGLALDLAQVTRVPMTAVLVMVHLTRVIPVGKRRVRCIAPCIVYLAFMGACAVADAAPILPLTLGGCAAALLPSKAEPAYRKSETSMAQVRLELMAGVLSQMQQLLAGSDAPPIDTSALLARTRERACGGCPNRKLCPDVPFPEDLLEREVSDLRALPFPCRKSGRMVIEIMRSREQLRTMQAERERRKEMRAALTQQYRFLGDYLRKTADELPRRVRYPRQRYQVEVAVCSAGKQSANGDRCAGFSGAQCRYYVVLCDGMGTGSAAATEGQSALSLLKSMLTAGFPAEYALRSFNSLLTLRGCAGASTVDLLEIDLTCASACIYKWGAAPSWLLRDGGAEKIGTATAPPGLSVSDARETTDRLSLRRGEVLALCSDGVDVEAVLRRGEIPAELPPGEVAAKLLEAGGTDSGDDATCAVVRLCPLTLST